ncbi:MAG: DUF268 domain-containing protein [Deltaproteobacteria bacterium]|nr:DUF268 domain-containing protein [Deltaproteobacteria bacterium]
MSSRARQLLSTLQRWSTTFGVDIKRAVRGACAIPWFVRDFVRLRNQNAEAGNPWMISCSAPSLHDKGDKAGITSGHYFHQDLFVAQRIFGRKPAHHLDVGSRVDGFVAHVASFMPIEICDLRPLRSSNPNILVRQLDICALPDTYAGCADSLSCLHALEHFGLGRYGDTVDLRGYELGFDGLYRMLRTNGIFYFSVPVGRERIVFNSHRVFSLSTLATLFGGRFDLISFSYVDDSGNFHRDVPLHEASIQECQSLEYGCAIFELRKLNRGEISNFPSI